MDIFDINSLTNFDDRFWRIDWFGYLSYHDETGDRRSTPLVDVYLSPLVSRPEHVRTFNSKKVSDYQNSRKVTVPVGYLTILRLGDIWHKGRLYHRPDYQQLTANNLDIDAKNTETLRVSKRQSNGQHLVPYSHHPYHMAAPSAYCEVFYYGSAKVIVPHWVILQAYFSHCSYLFTQLFRFGLELNSIYSLKDSFIKDGHGYLQIKKRVHDIAALDVARIAWDSAANKAYSMVSYNLAMANNNHWPITPKSQFPFTGKTSLTLKGKYLAQEQDDTNSRTFFAFQILSCTAEYPCDELTFYRDNPGKVDDAPVSSPKHSPENRKPRNIPRIKNTVELTPNQEPDNDLENLILSVQETTKLLGTAKVKVEKKYKNLSSTNTPRPSINQKDVNTANTGEGSPHGDGAPTEFTQSSEGDEKNKKELFLFPSKICRLEIFRRVCQKLTSFKNLKGVSFININGHLLKSSGDYSYFPKTLTPTGRDRTWRYLDYIKGSDSTKAQQRRALIAHIVMDNASLYVIEVERRMTESADKKGWVELDNIAMLSLHSNTEMAIETKALEQLFLTCAEESGTWLDRNARPSIYGFEIKTIKHPENETILTPEIHDQRIISVLESALGVKFEQK